MTEDKAKSEPQWSNRVEGVSYSKGRVYGKGSKFVPPQPQTDLEKTVADCMAVVARMVPLEDTMSERLEELNSRRRYWSSNEPALLLSMGDTFWQIAGNTLTLQHHLAKVEGIPSLLTTVNPDQAALAHEIIKHRAPAVSLKDAAMSAALNLIKQTKKDTI